MHSAISALILTFNEEANIGRVLEQLRSATEVVIVDSLSTDQTTEIARRFANVRIVSRPFDDHVAQWNYGLTQIRTPWVLTLDADYVLSDALVDELRGEPGEDGSTGYAVRFRYCIGGSPLRGSLYPPRVVLFRRDRATYADDGHTQRLVIDGTVRELAAPIDHDDRKPLSRWLAAQNRYAALEFDKLLARDRTLRRVERMRRAGWIMPLLTPIYCLLVKGLILDGAPGLYYTLQRTYFETLLALKLREPRMLATPPDRRRE